ncbi:MAG TPA: lytic transglycosylase domain-containing protein [Gaiellaceae bacterium]
MGRRRKRWKRQPPRLTAALALLAAALVAALAVALLRSPPRRTARESIDHWAKVYGVNVHLARAVAWQESGNNPRAVSSAGARGVMQVVPGTWRYTEQLLGRRVDHTSDGNIRIGVAYLRYLLHEFHGNLRLALAAYHQGPGAVREHGVYPSSARYVANVLALRRRL